MQFKKLKKILIHSYENFDFYRDLMKSVNFNPYNFTDMEEIEQLPIIDKEMYRYFTESTLKKNPQLINQYHKDKTSGSTGEPLHIYRKGVEREYVVAKFLRALVLNGYSVFEKIYCAVTPRRLVKRDSILQKFGLMRRYCISNTETPENLVRGYIESSPDLLYANKTHLILMALHISENEIEVKQPNIYVSAGEVLDHKSREIIQNAFGPNLVEVYGAVEFGNLGFQIKGNKNIDFNHDTNILELDDNGGINKKKGFCIITDLHIRSFPLIRYRLGDWIETSEKNEFLVIKSIRGRDDDFATLKDGSKIPPQTFKLIIDRFPGIRQFRIIQKSRDLIKFNLVLEEGIKESRLEESLIRALKTEIDDEMTYQVEYVASISPDSTGKLRFLVSEI